MTILLLFACQEAEVYTINVGPTSKMPQTPPEEQVSSDIPPPNLSSSEVETHLNALLAYGAVEPVRARDVYINLQTQGDLNCPGDSPFQLMGIIDPCTSESGYTYSGLTILRGSTGQLAFPDSFSFLADCYIIDPDGNRFVGAGELKYGSWGDRITGGIGVTSEGTWSYPLDDGWVGTENSIWIDAIVSWTDGTNDWYVKLDGATTLNETSIFYDEVYISKDCPGGWGNIELRAESGYWYTLSLSNCSGCGTVRYNGSDIGEACLNTEKLGSDLLELYHPNLSSENE